ncbi:hypothetical protein Ancab_035412 [Ancistrocladus abbreviatus]
MYGRFLQTYFESYSLFSNILQIRTTKDASYPNFRDLQDLHKCANYLLHSPLIQQELAHHQQQTSSVLDISETILRMLELCSTRRDLLAQVKQHLQGLQYIFRRAIIDADMDLEAKVSATYNLGRKNLKKEIIKCLREFEGMKSKYFTLDLSFIDYNLIVVVHVLRKVRMAAICILESLYSLISLPTTQNQKSNKGSLALKFMAINCRR